MSWTINGPSGCTPAMRILQLKLLAAKARSALYLREEDRRPLLTQEAFLAGARQFPSAGKSWLHRLKDIDDAELGILVNEVPPGRITDVSAEFAKRLLIFNKRALLALVNDF